MEEQFPNALTYGATQAEDGAYLGKDGQPLSKKGYKKLKAAYEKQQKKAERQQKQAEQKAAAEANEVDQSEGKYGERPLNQSAVPYEETSQIVYNHVKSLGTDLVGQEVRIRARSQNTRPQGGSCFIILREEMFTVQCMLAKGEQVSKKMINFTKSIPNESIIEVVGTVSAAPKPIASCTQTEIEVFPTEVWIVHKSFPELPFQLGDASRRVEDQAAEYESEKKEQDSEEPTEETKETPETTDKPAEGKEKKEIKVSQSTRLDNRIIDL